MFCMPREFRAGICCPEGASDAAPTDSGTPWDWQNGDLRSHRLPPHAPGPGASPWFVCRLVEACVLLVSVVWDDCANLIKSFNLDTFLIFHKSQSVLARTL